jgi:hypothetical protein
MKTTRSRLPLLRNKALHLVFLLLLVMGSVYAIDTTPSPVNASVQQTPTGRSGLAQQRTTSGRVIPTTSNPTGNGITASRTYANTSFESNDSGCTMSTYQYARESDMRGWLTSAPSGNASCNGAVYSPGRTGRIIELQVQATAGYTVQQGTAYAELNADFASMMYQPICFNNSDEISYSFAHRPMGNRTDVTEFRIGIPSGLPAGSRAADSYSRQIAQASSTQGGGIVTSTSQTAYTGTTSTTNTISAAKWGIYTGVHTLPSTGWAGIFNVGFVAISGASPQAGNLLDAITMGLSPLVDLGSSRDTTAGEQSTPTALRIRINGRIASGAKIALTTIAGDAVPDTDYSIGSVTAGAFGSVTTTHTAGTNVWVFDIPPGDYDGGVTPANNTGGLTIPIAYSYDQVSEGTEYVQFEISDPGVDGGTTDWAKGDPTCDTSEKNDGVVYTITNVDPTATPTNTPTSTFTPSLTSTPTMTYTPSKTPSPTLELRAPGEVPTTSNPTINTSIAGVRTMANTSFEVTDTTCSLAVDTWSYIRQEYMSGWFTAHPAEQESCNNIRSGPSSYRVIELNPRADAPDGNNIASLNAEVASFLYQKLCVKSGETFDFEFYHNVGGGNRTDIAAFRLGIPSGLPAGSVAADTYDREVLRAATTVGSTVNIVTGVSKTDGSGTTASAASIDTGWGKYSGTHTLPASGYDGVRNIGFFGIQSAGPAGGNLLDKISLGLTPFMDMGASRDATIVEGASGSVKIRINGRVGAGTTVVLRKREGTATSDSDFTIGTVSAGVYGNATVTHTSGSNSWTISVPAGDYDGGIFPSNNTGGLTIPVSYLYDVTNDTGEYVMFQLGAPGDDGASSNWDLSDPTCDGSFKDDGVVHTITNLAPTATNTATPTHTFTPTNTPTPTFTPTATPTPAGQFITFATPADKTDGDASFTLAATSSAGLAITYTSSTPSVCTVSGATVTIVAPGSCTVAASAAAGTSGGISYNAAPDVTRSFTVKTRQTITFPNIPAKSYLDADFTLAATASSGLSVSYSSTTPSICSVSGGTVHVIAIGTCALTAHQTGGTNAGVVYAAAPSIRKSFSVTGVPQVITAAPIPQKYFYNSEFSIGASVVSTLPVTYLSATPTVCAVVAGKVRIISAGTCRITARQAGGTSDGTIYDAAPDVTYTFTISSATATFTPTATRTATPTPIPLLIKKAAVGSSFVLGLLQNGTLVTWGMNKEFQTNIAPCCGSGVTDIAVGTNFALALKGGRVFGWGANTRGQVTMPTGATKDVSAIAAGYAHGLALKSNGTVVCWGNNLSGQCNIPKKLAGIKAVAGGTDHSLIIQKNDTVKGYGKNNAGQITIPASLGKVTAISAGCDHSLAIKSTGTAMGWGGNRFSQAKVPTNLVDVKSISAGCNYSMAMMNDGTVFGWGRNENNQVTIPKGITNAFSIGAGYVNSVISLRDGRVIVIGAPENDALITRTPTKTATPTP